MNRIYAHLQAIALACGLLFLFPAPEAAAQTPQRTVGIFYALWHCPQKAGTYDLSKILESDNPNALGDVNAFHWWGKPSAGYYCLSENDALLKTHAAQLKAAGIDYVYVDITNWPHTMHGEVNEMIIKPFERMLAVWGGMAASERPMIIPWVAVSPDAPPPGAKDMIEYVKGKLTNNSLAFNPAKPVVFVAPSGSGYATTKIANYASSLITVKFWAQNPDGGATDEWGFISRCADWSAFKTARAQAVCNQRGSADGQQISVAPAFALNWISYAPTAVPKFNGMTFLRQMETARTSGRQYVMITGWNEWVVQRTSWTGYGDRLFTDQYNDEYNRDLEPSARSGTLYYDLLKRAVAALRANTSVTDVAGSFGQTKGHIDGLVNYGGGEWRLNGWACSYGARIPIDVHVYVGASAPATFLGSAPADYASTDVNDRNAIAGACGSDGVAYRFSLRVPLSVRQAHRGKKIYVYGFHPAAGANNLLVNSGAFTIPAP